MENHKKQNIRNLIIKRTDVIGKEICNYINPHLLQFDDVIIEDENDIYLIDSVDLLNSNRIDIIIKYLYAKFRTLKINSQWAKQIYIEHIDKLNGFLEGDGSGKVGKEAFLSRFDQIIDQITNQGFNQKLSVIPVDKDLIIIDGSHRVGASLVKNLELTCIYLRDHPAPIFSFTDLKKMDFNMSTQDAIALEYCKLKKNTYIVTIFPVGRGKNEEIRATLEQYSKIIYEKDILFADRVDTYTHLVREIYFQDTWIGSWNNRFEGAKLKAQACFKHQGKTRIFLIEANSLDIVKRAKNEIRSIFGGLQDCIHINDTHKETIHLAQIYFNNNSIHLINKIDLKQDQSFEILIKEFKSWAKNKDYDLEYFCIDGSGILSAYGIRNARDLDILHHSSISLDIQNININSHNSETKYHNNSIDDVIFNPQNHLYYCGLKFISINNLKMMKINRNEGKDIEDVNLINKKIGLPYEIKVIFRYYTKKYLFFTYSINTSSLIQKVLKKIKKHLKGINENIKNKFKTRIAIVQDFFKPYVRTIKYQDFILFYSKGTSVIEVNGNPPVRIGGFYEPQESKIIVGWLTNTQEKEPIFVDIGANIGLITLNILSCVPHTKIYAFEPAKHQHTLFRKTIEANHFEDQVLLYDQALSKDSGKAKFAIHSSQHSSGDGFFNTFRAGDTETITVNTQTLDQWWNSIGCPLINAIKIDTEGAELWILQGGINMITNCKPKILLEINLINLRSYPYEAIDILNWLKENFYILRDLSGNPINPDNLMKILLNNESFQAVPINTKKS